MLDEHKACRAAGLERGCYLLDLPLREPESVALDLLLRLGKLITITSNSKPSRAPTIAPSSSPW